MKKQTLFLVAFVVATCFSACKKDNDSGGGNDGGTTPQTNCKLKSIKETITATGSPTSYSGFVLYYDAKDIINRANFIDSTTGKEDSTSYALLSRNSGNLTDVKVFQKGTASINFAMTYSTQDKVEQRFLDLPTPFGLAKIEQTYFYDSKGYISYTVRRTEIDIPNIGKIINKDSALYQNYNSFGRPEGVIVYNSVTTQQGTQPYEFSEEIKYEYDAKGNRTKISTKEDVGDPFKVTYEATFDANKTAGEGEEAYKLLTKLFIDDWDDPNLNSSDIDNNLIVSETEYDANGQGETKTTTYTFNDKGNPASSVAKATGETTNTDFTYWCK